MHSYSAHGAGDNYTTVTNSVADGHTSSSSCPPPCSSSHPYSDLSPVARFLQQDIFFPPSPRVDSLLHVVDVPALSSHPIILPDITPYAPPNIDRDITASLAAVYRSHCTSLVECVRFMRLKQFFGLFVSFQGTLTVPVQKLFAEPSIAPWIRESDWATYKVCSSTTPRYIAITALGLG